MTEQNSTRIAVVTGAGRGFGLALTTALDGLGPPVIAVGRDADRLRSATARLRGVRAVPADITDPDGRAAIVAAAQEAGGLDLLVHNASELGPSPLPRLADYPPDALRAV